MHQAYKRGVLIQCAAFIQNVNGFKKEVNCTKIYTLVLEGFEGKTLIHHSTLPIC